MNEKELVQKTRSNILNKINFYLDKEKKSPEESLKFSEAIKNLSYAFNNLKDKSE